MAMTIRGHKVSVATFTSKKAGTAYGALAFLYTINQLGPGGMSSNTLGNPTWTTGQKLQNFFIGVPAWRLTGQTMLLAPNSGLSPQGVKFTVSKATNNIFWLGVALTLYGAVGGHFGLPYASAVLRVGVPVAVGGFVGGGFDPDPPGATPTSGLPSIGSMSLMSAAPGAGLPAQGSFTDAVRA